MLGRAAQQADNGSPRTPLGLELVGPLGGGAHLARALTGGERIDHRQPRGRRTVAPLPTAPALHARRGRHCELLGERDVAAIQCAVGGAEGERGGLGDRVGAEVAQPPVDHLAATVGEVGHDVGPHEVAGSDRVTGGDRVGDRAIDLAALLVPGARAAVKAQLEVGLEAPQLAAERLAEQPLPAIRPVGGVERDEQLAGVGEPRQGLRRSAPLEHVITDGARQLVEHRRADHEVPQVVGHGREDVIAKVLGEQVVVAPEALVGVWTWTLSHRDGGQIQRRRPSFGPADERLDLLELELELEAGAHEQARGLRGRHRQVLCSHLDQLAVCP